MDIIQLAIVLNLLTYAVAAIDDNDFNIVSDDIIFTRRDPDSVIPTIPLVPVNPKLENVKNKNVHLSNEQAVKENQKAQQINNPINFIRPLNSIKQNNLPVVLKTLTPMSTNKPNQSQNCRRQSCKKKHKIKSKEDDVPNINTRKENELRSSIQTTPQASNSEESCENNNNHNNMLRIIPNLSFKPETKGNILNNDPNKKVKIYFLKNQNTSKYNTETENKTEDINNVVKHNEILEDNYNQRTVNSSKVIRITQLPIKEQKNESLKNIILQNDKTNCQLNDTEDNKVNNKENIEDTTIDKARTSKETEYFDEHFSTINGYPSENDDLSIKRRYDNEEETGSASSIVIKSINYEETKFGNAINTNPNVFVRNDEVINYGEDNYNNVINNYNDGNIYYPVEFANNGANIAYLHTPFYPYICDDERKYYDYNPCTISIQNPGNKKLQETFVKDNTQKCCRNENGGEIRFPDYSDENSSRKWKMVEIRINDPKNHKTKIDSHCDCSRKQY